MLNRVAANFGQVFVPQLGKGRGDFRGVTSGLWLGNCKLRKGKGLVLLIHYPQSLSEDCRNVPSRKQRVDIFLVRRVGKPKMKGANATCPGEKQGFVPFENH